MNEKDREYDSLSFINIDRGGVKTMHSKSTIVHYHYSTKNISFIKMSKILKDLGIKNNKFFLKLYDKDLEYVDPFDDNLSIEIQAKIIREIKRNFWYFIREVVRIVVPGGTKPYELHRGNLAMSWCLINNINSILILPRQNGKSIGAVAYYLWLYNFGTTNSEISFMNKKYQDSQLNLRRLKEMREALPMFLQIYDPRNDTNNLTRLVNSTTNNKIIAMPTANDEASADNLGKVEFPIYSGLPILKFNFSEKKFL